VIPGLVLDAQGGEVSHDIEAEMRSCFDNVKAILEECGATWDDIIDVTVFLTAMKADWTVYNRVYGEFFPPGPSQPCRTTVEIAGLPQGGDGPIHFEIKVVAKAPAFMPGRSPTFGRFPTPSWIPGGREGPWRRGRGRAGRRARG
jgi:enamine deaminase RidA (YjgF/YER057c/UK114 family)